MHDTELDIIPETNFHHESAPSFPQALRGQCMQLLEAIGISVDDPENASLKEVFSTMEQHADKIGRTAFMFDLDGVMTNGKLGPLLRMHIDEEALQTLEAFSTRFPQFDIFIVSSRPISWPWQNGTATWVDRMSRALLPDEPSCVERHTLTPQFITHPESLVTQRGGRRMILTNAGKTPLERLVLFPLYGEGGQRTVGGVIRNTYFRFLDKLIGDPALEHVFIVDDYEDCPEISGLSARYTKQVGYITIPRGMTALRMLYEVGTFHRPWVGRVFKFSLFAATGIALTTLAHSTLINQRPKR